MTGKSQLVPVSALRPKPPEFSLAQNRQTSASLTLTAIDPRRDRTDSPDFAAQHRWRVLPVTGEGGRKLWCQVNQRMGPEQYS